jgi:hypothetical protein
MTKVAPNKADPTIDTYVTAITHYVQGGGTRYAYRRCAIHGWCAD